LPHSFFSNLIDPHLNFCKIADGFPEFDWSNFVQEQRYFKGLHKAKITLAVIALSHLMEEGCSADALLALGNGVGLLHRLFSLARARRYSIE